jgi:hypothetical protein
MQQGTQHTEETKAKMRAAHAQRRPMSEDTKRRISAARTGTKHSEETKRKISARFKEST